MAGKEVIVIPSTGTGVLPNLCIKTYQLALSNRYDAFFLLLIILLIIIFLFDASLNIALLSIMLFFIFLLFLPDNSRCFVA